jgi:hypothetical protein
VKPTIRGRGPLVSQWTGTLPSAIPLKHFSSLVRTEISMSWQASTLRDFGTDAVGRVSAMSPMVLANQSTATPRIDVERAGIERGLFMPPPAAVVGTADSFPD